jgi:hypothetical protein
MGLSWQQGPLGRNPNGQVVAHGIDRDLSVGGVTIAA